MFKFNFKIWVFSLILIWATAITGCSSHPGGSGEGSNNSMSSSSSASSSPNSSSSSSASQHPYIYNDTARGTYVNTTLIYMASACSLQIYALSNINLMPTPYYNPGMGTVNNKLFIYIDATVDYNVFPAWVKPGGLFVINYNSYNKQIYGIESFDRVFMPSNPDACNSNTLYQVLEFIKTNYGITGLTAMVVWGHGDGWIPLNGGQTGPINLSTGHISGSGKIYPSVGINNNSGNTLYDDSIAWAISNTVGSVTYLGFDACSMGNLEDVYTYMITNIGVAWNVIASPGIEASIGWSYDWVSDPATYFSSQLPQQPGVSLSYFYSDCLYNLYSLDSMYQGLTGNNLDITFWITNSRKYILPSKDPAAHYVKLTNLIYDIQNYDGSLSSPYNDFMNRISAANKNVANMNIWLPVFPKQYYNAFVKKYHSAQYIKLFRDDPNLADWFTNAAWGQTENSVAQFIGFQFFSPGYCTWNTLGTTLNGGSVNVTGTYHAYFLDQRNENQTAATAIPLTSAIIKHTNVAYVAGEGQVDYYSITITSGGNIRLRVSGCTVSNVTTISNVQFLDSSQNVLQDLTASFRNANPSDGGALAASYTSGGTIPITQNTEYGNLSFVEIHTNLSAGTYYIKVSAQDLMTEYYNPTDAPYLIYPLSLTNGETAAGIQ